MAAYRFGQAAHAHVAVADGLQHLQAMSLGNLIEGGEMLIELFDETLWLEALRQPCEAFEIRKENRRGLEKTRRNAVILLEFVGGRPREDPEQKVFRPFALRFDF